MKSMICLLLVLLVLTGCSGQQQELDRAMALRAKLLAQTVSFEARITADYGDKTYTFSLRCTVDTQGAMTFTVSEPESISGITGTVSSSGGTLTFDGEALAFERMADGQITPVSAPWVMMRALRSGYLTSCTVGSSGLILAVDDSYEEDALHLDVWLDKNDLPSSCDIYWQGRRLLSIDVTGFTFV